MQRFLNIYWFVGLTAILAIMVCLWFIFGNNDREKTVMSDYDFVLTISNEEHSMDSNSTAEEYYLTGNKLTHNWKYSGYHPNNDFVREKNANTDLSDADLEQFKSLVNKIDPDEQFVATSTDDGRGVNTITVTLKNISPVLELTISGLDGSFANSKNYAIITEISNLFKARLP